MPGPRHAELMHKALLRAAVALDYKEIHRCLLNEQDYADILGSSVSDSSVLGRILCDWLMQKSQQQDGCMSHFHVQVKDKVTLRVQDLYGLRNLSARNCFAAIASLLDNDNFIYPSEVGFE